MKTLRFAFLVLLAIALNACNDDPQMADREAYEKTVQLHKQYGPLLVGTWHCENIGERQRFFERLSFQEDGTLTGYRKWQTRKLVTIEGEQSYTDWENLEPIVGTFTGTWRLQWDRNDSGVGENHLNLYAQFDELDDAGKGWLAYAHNFLFDCDGATFLRIIGGYQSIGSDIWTSYQRGDAEPGF